jgi:cytochrome c556
MMSEILSGEAMKHIFGLTMAALGLAFLGTAGTAGDKATLWKPFLPADAYKVMTDRSIKTIETAAKSDDKEAPEKIRVEAIILAGCTLAVADVKKEDVSMLRGASFAAVRMAKEPTSLTDLSKLRILAPADVRVLKAGASSLDVLMEIFRNKSKGGEGIPADLQYHPKLKNTNGVEALIGALSSKKLSDENAEKVSKELPLLAYRVAVVGAVTHEMAPEKGAAQWRELASQMRDASVALAEAAGKKNADGIQKAATTLEDSCTKCHGAFKKK